MPLLSRSTSPARRPNVTKPSPTAVVTREAEESAVARLAAGDVDALDVIYGWYADDLFHLAYRLTRSVADAEDVVHDVFIDLARAASKYREQGRLGGWLRTLVIHRTIDEKRRASRGPKQITSAAEEVDVQSPITTSDPIARDLIDRAVARLSPALRDVFVLRAIDERTHAEIAEMLGISARASEVRYFRAVKALRRTLGTLR